MMKTLPIALLSTFLLVGCPDTKTPDPGPSMVPKPKAFSGADTGAPHPAAAALARRQSSA